MPPRRTTRTATLPGSGNAQQALIGLLKDHVREWVDDGYPGASDLTRELLHHWFDEPHLMPNGSFFLSSHSVIVVTGESQPM